MVYLWCIIYEGLIGREDSYPPREGCSPAWRFDLLDCA